LADFIEGMPIEQEFSGVSLRGGGRGGICIMGQ
jgi:hypothetical protein